MTAPPGLHKGGDVNDQLVRVRHGTGFYAPSPATRPGRSAAAGVVGLVTAFDVGVPVPAIQAAVGFLALQILAAGLHLSRGEAKDTGLNLVLILLAAVAAWPATAL
ncbi:DoxX family protein [Streptomyces canus]|uniref:DoxX family protein n=1 Tax=Streptomyces canus TaxID=58343 RepID=UPI00277DCCFA|nr:DoxX family protein [Streptomyces canus]MDQ1069876.1 hypothetical protein [Streptomyces canus]